MTFHSLLTDNNMCGAVIDMPTLDGHTAGAACGVLEYTDPSHIVHIHYAPTHPNNFAAYSFQAVRGGGTYITPLPASSSPVDPPPPDFTRSVHGLLDTCSVAAFAVYLYVAATATNGVWRQTQYDASHMISFCLAP